METTNFAKLSISELACAINKDWRTQKGGINVHARPYIDAMLSLHSINDRYIADSGRTIVGYFLSNAAQWKGETAKAIKAELKKRMK